MFKTTRDSKAEEYKRKALDLEVELSQVRLNYDMLKASGARNVRAIAELKEELRVEKRRRELAEASVKALEDHLRVLNETKK